MLGDVGVFASKIGDSAVRRLVRHVESIDIRIVRCCVHDILERGRQAAGVAEPYERLDARRESIRFAYRADIGEVEAIRAWITGRVVTPKGFICIRGVVQRRGGSDADGSHVNGALRAEVGDVDIA